MRIFAHRKLIFVIVLMCAMRVSAQEPEKLNIALKINPDIKQFSGKMIASATNGAVTYTDPASNGLGKAPGEVLIKIEPADAASHTYRILVDADGNGDLGNDTAQVALPSSSVTVKINRKSAIGATQTLPYLIDYSRDTDRNRQARERFLWFPNYRAEGKLKTKNCEALLSVLDLTNDGQFDADDSAKGTNIGLDRNGDGRIWGKDEYLKGEVQAVCREIYPREATRSRV